MLIGKYRKTGGNKPGPAPEKSSPAIPNWALPAVLVFTAILYSRALQNGITSCDDSDYITNNPFLTDLSWGGIKAVFTSFYECNYHPLTLLAYMCEYALSGFNPLPYHAFNVLLHLLNTWLVFKLAEQLSGKKITALVVCVLFAVHPMHVESVAWASETKDVLYALFYLSSLVVYNSYCASGYKTGPYVVSILLFLLSLLSKTTAVTLPLVLVAIDLYKGRKATFGLLMEKAPFFILSLFFGILNLVAQKVAMADLDATYSLINRVFLFTGSLSFYLVKLVAPFQLSALHFFPGTAHGLLPWLFYASLPFLLLVVWLIARRNTYRKEIIFGVSFFLATISVMLQVIPVGSAFASERYTYIPYVGLFYIAGQWMAGMGTAKYRNIVIGIFSLIVLGFSAQSWLRIGVWKDDSTLFGDIIQKDSVHSTNYAMARFEAGSANSKNGNNPAALVDFTQSILFCPKFENAWFNRALIYFGQGDFASAIAGYSKVISLDPKNALVYNYRAWAYYQSGNKDSAILDYNAAIAFDSSNAEAYNNRGWMEYLSGNKQPALRDYNKAIALNPRFSGAYNNRGWASYEAGDVPAAISDYNRAITFNPENEMAYRNLAVIKTNTGDLRGAIQDYDSLIKFRPGDNNAYGIRGSVKLSLRDTAGACADWSKAAQLGNADAAGLLRQYCH